MPQQKLRLEVAGGEVSAVLSVPRKFVIDKTPAVVLAHGAGSGMDDPLLTYLQVFLMGRGYLTLSFNFPYREKGRKVPDREEVLEGTLQAAYDFLHDHEAYRPGMIFVGGKSMGGRMASHLAARRLPAAGLLLLAYPLHAPGRPDRVRDAHLSSIKIPTLFISGTRDALAPQESLAAVVGPLRRACVQWIEGGDHSFKMLRSSGQAAEDVWQHIAESASEWLDQVAQGGTRAVRQPVAAAQVHNRTARANVAPATRGKARNSRGNAKGKSRRDS